MSHLNAKMGLTKMALSTVAGALIIGPVFSEEIDQVTVTASRPTEKIIGRSGSLAVKRVSLAYKVSYADLDLATHSGALALQTRIKNAAQDACDKLDKDYPGGENGGKVCVKLAVEAAMPNANTAIAAAERNAHAK
jgi:UrcA family protein